MSKKEKELIVRSNTAIALPGETIDLPADFINEDDFGYQQKEENPIFPYISIRQKDPRDETGITWKKGLWKIANTPTPANDIPTPLMAIVLAWNVVRTYFPEGAESPYCKSINGDTGSLKTRETAGGYCDNCQYNRWGENGDRPACTEGRNLYAYCLSHGPCIIRLGRSALKPWRAFDNLMKTKLVKAPNGSKIRIPYHLNILEFDTAPVVRPGFDKYWIPVIRHNSIINDKETLDIMRELLKSKEQYDRTAEQSDLGGEDINGSGAKETEYDYEAHDPKRNPDGSPADNDAMNRLAGGENPDLPF